MSLLDLDVYAPSLHSYFDYSPAKWINDFLNGAATLKDVMVDMTSVIQGHASTESMKNGGGGRLWLGLSNPQKDEIFKLEGQGRQTSTSIQMLRKFLELREGLISDYDCDYVIVDTSPGIRYWSINSLAIADTILLALKMDKLDIEGTRKMTSDMYESIKKLGGRLYLLLNRTNGYCAPSSQMFQENTIPLVAQQDWEKMHTELIKDIGLDIISAIPCYCDIQFSTAEFLTVIRHPEHPFSKQLTRIAEGEQLKL